LHLRCKLPRNAVSLLAAVGWAGDGTEAMTALSTLFIHLTTRSPGLPTREVLDLVQAALGTYHSPPRPVSPAVESRHGAFVEGLTRRFFFLLLRSVDRFVGLSIRHWVMLQFFFSSSQFMNGN
jgi:hypothetical protein